MKKATLAIGVTSLLLFATPMVAVATVASLMSVNLMCENTSDVVAATETKPVSAKGLTASQLENARLIIGIGRNRGRSLRDIKIALMTGMQESKLRNLSYGDRDSLGIYQQRAGWGTAKQRRDPAYAINAFYKELEKFKNRDKMSLMETAIAVQRPSRAAYMSRSNNFNSWGKMADQLLEGQTGGVAKASPMIYDAACEESEEIKDTPKPPAINVPAGSWVRPLPSLRVGSQYGMRFHPILHYTRLHDGVDLSGSTGTPIYSMGDGKVVYRGKNRGAGNYLRISYAGGFTASYMHMSRFGNYRVGDKVKAGAVIGYVGATGLATGPHLHLGMKKHGKSINPIPVMCSHGIKVPGPKGCSKYR